MLVICVCMFASAIYFMNYGNDEDESIYDSYFLGLTDAFIHVWLLALGEFGTEGYAGSLKTMLWILFFIATFVV